MPTCQEPDVECTSGTRHGPTCIQKALDVGSQLRLAQADSQRPEDCSVSVNMASLDGIVGLFVEKRWISSLYCYNGLGNFVRFSRVSRYFSMWSEWIRIEDILAQTKRLFVSLSIIYSHNRPTIKYTIVKPYYDFQFVELYVDFPTCRHNFNSNCTLCHRRVAESLQDRRRDIYIPVSQFLNRPMTELEICGSYNHFPICG